MSNFKVGEKVVCVGCFIDIEEGITYPIKNNIYTVRSIDFDNGDLFIRLDEIKNPIIEYSDGALEARFWIKRFRKLDYEFAENLLAEISEAMKSEAIAN